MAFRFRLEKVARYRQQLVDEQSRAVAAADRVVTGLRTRLAAVDEDLARHRRDDGAPSAGLSVGSLMARTLWGEHLAQVRADLVGELTAAQAEAAARRERLAEAWRDLEVLDKLRARQQAAWQEEQERRDGLAMDEIGQVRAERQRRSKVAT